MVFVNYCDGGSFSGTRTEPVTYNGTRPPPLKKPPSPLPRWRLAKLHVRRALWGVVPGRQLARVEWGRGCRAGFEGVLRTDTRSPARWPAGRGSSAGGRQRAGRRLLNSLAGRQAVYERAANAGGDHGVAARRAHGRRRGGAAEGRMGRMAAHGRGGSQGGGGRLRQAKQALPPWGA